MSFQKKISEGISHSDLMHLGDHFYDERGEERKFRIHEWGALLEELPEDKKPLLKTALRNAITRGIILDNADAAPERDKRGVLDSGVKYSIHQDDLQDFRTYYKTHSGNWRKGRKRQ